MYTAEIFLKLIHDDVVEDMRNTGILASLTAAQALIESNKGNSGLTQRANNLFGMKGEYKGLYVTMPTKEWDGTQYITINAKFRKYPSWKESIADHSGLFLRADRYANLRGCTDYKKACQYVREDGYATSPTYTTTLINTIESYRLYEWDREGIAGMYPKTGNPYAEPVASIKKGMRGNGVRWVQYQLNDKGGYKLIVDGIFGGLTDGAVRDFQKAHGLVVDGIVGPQTRIKLAS